MVTINGVENTVAPGRPVSVINGGKFNRYNGLRPHEYDKWRMVWNGNHFAPPEPNSVLYLPGVPGFGNTVFDYSGNGNNGTIYDATWTRLPSGLWGLNFDGDDYITVPSRFTATRPFTFMAWAKSDNLTLTQFMYSEGNTASDVQFFGVRHTDTGKAQGQLKDDAGNVASIIGAGSVGTGWNLFTWVSRADNDHELYLNLVSQGTNATNIGAMTLNVANIGRIQRVSSLFYWIGKIGIVCIFNSALSVPAIGNHFNQERHLFGV